MPWPARRRLLRQHPAGALLPYFGRILELCKKSRPGGGRRDKGGNGTMLRATLESQDTVTGMQLLAGDVQQAADLMAQQDALQAAHAAAGV